MPKVGKVSQSETLEQQQNQQQNQQQKTTQDSSDRYRYNIRGTHMLSEFQTDEILRDISLRISDGRRLIIPIGFPQSGKSMFIASLIAYAFRRNTNEDNSCNFNVTDGMDTYGVSTILEALDKKTVLPSTRPDEMTIIDLDMESSYRKKRVRISLLDFSGEDINRLVGVLKDDEQGSANKIGEIMAACIAQRAIFACLTPVDEHMQEFGMISDFDRAEDTHMHSFITSLKTQNPRLYNMTKILLIATKWDKLPGRISPEKYLKLHRNNLYNEYSGYSRSYGLIPYSVGDVVKNTIIRMSLRSPKNFWYTLYRWCTGKHVLPWWIRIFS